MCCMAEPKVYDILRWQIGEVHKNLAPDGYFLQHDEIRVQGWDESCQKTHGTPGQLLAENVKKCVAMVRSEDPGKPIYVWSDMFDPFHNAPKTGRYYLVKGDGPWYGSWRGLDKDVVIVNWNSQPDKRVDSLQHFAALGPPADSGRILRRAGGRDRRLAGGRRPVQGVVGVMYTTWQQKYGDLEAFAAELKETLSRFHYANLRL